MLVRELLTRDVAQVRDVSPLDSAIRVLAEQRVSALPVVDATGRVVGILSEADVLRLHLSADPRAHLRPVVEEAEVPWPTTVAEVMSADPVVAHEGTDVAEVARVLADTGWKSLPVVDEDHALVGMVSRSDVIHQLATRDADIWLRVVRELGRLGHTDWSVGVSRGVVTVSGVRRARDASLAAAVAAGAPGVRDVVVQVDEEGTLR
ncbi:CBS domain-containing protein [Pedococcus dokdonensis]|uniref:CBS domain-containing protein n=1 Tax=Pedococcus dokdonensis TaxID=443156 RepID=A0A1H0NAW0_9MICO|nr:CBS domain-containing protein [Pedococcus dokdonensis]SDO89575.1 CBS domain-containing protein [Pedococcus dokdonensis]